MVYDEEADELDLFLEFSSLRKLLVGPSYPLVPA